GRELPPAQPAGAELLDESIWIVQLLLDPNRAVQQVQDGHWQADDAHAQEPEPVAVAEETVADDLRHPSLQRATGSHGLALRTRGYNTFPRAASPQLLSAGPSSRGPRQRSGMVPKA